MIEGGVYRSKATALVVGLISAALAQFALPCNIAIRLAV